MIFSTYVKEHVSVKSCVRHKDMFCEPGLCLASWLGEVNLRKSVARDFYRGTHVVTISLTISLDYLPKI